MPKSIAVGNAVAEVTGVAALPLAIKDTTGVLTASLVNVTTPVTDPADCGANEIVTACAVPAASVRGNVGLTTVKPLPETVPAKTVVFPVPGFDSSIV